MGVINWVSGYIIGCKGLTQTIQDMANSKSKLVWTPSVAKAFEDFKSKTREAPCRYIPDNSLPFECWSDASKNAASFVCTQKDRDGISRFIGAASRLFSKAKLKASIFTKEVIACLVGLKSYRHILTFSDILMNVDLRRVGICLRNE